MNSKTRENKSKIQNENWRSHFFLSFLSMFLDQCINFNNVKLTCIDIKTDVSIAITFFSLYIVFIYEYKPIRSRNYKLKYFIFGVLSCFVANFQGQFPPMISIASLSIRNLYFINISNIFFILFVFSACFCFSDAYWYFVFRTLRLNFSRHWGESRFIFGFAFWNFWAEMFS